MIIAQKNNISEQQASIKDEIKIREYGLYYLLPSLFVLSGLYFFLFGNYIFFYQENMSLFVFTCDYLEQFTSKPGGLLEYTGNFLSQFYFNNIYGALIQSSVLISISVVFLKINKKLSPAGSFSLLFAVLVSCILILMQMNINYQIHNNLGFLSASLFFLISISSHKKISRILILAFFPLFFFITGAFIWIYLGMCLSYYVLQKKVIYPVCLLTIAGLSLLLFKGIIFLQPWSELLYYPLPSWDYFSNPIILWLLFLFFVFYPALLKLITLIKIRKDFSRTISTYSVLFALALTIFLISKIYNKEVVDLFKLEKMFFAGDWNGVIEHQETYQSKNLVAEYYYNTALSENGMLCDRIFFGPQDYGTKSVMIPWNSQISINKMFRGVYFYYSIGLINEAHRWAYESMVIQGYRPENIKLLIKTDLINGHFKITEKYINVLKKTLHYRSWAKKYEAMVLNPELIKSDPELGEKINLKPKVDFLIRIRNPEKNIISLLQANPGNKKAFEYKLTCFMLEKEVKGILNDFNRLKDMGYSKIPRHLEEAAILVRTQMGPLAELNGLRISHETESRFSKYESSRLFFEKNKSPGDSVFRKEFGNTFWYYLDFVKPQY